MQFIVNGVIRSLSIQERTYELKRLLLGKKINLETTNSLEVTDIEMTNHSISFKSSREEFLIGKVKKIDINLVTQQIRIASTTKQFIISLI